MIFKKQLSVLLTCFLLVSNLGLIFNIHYCDDEIASITINSVPTIDQKDECCGIIEKESQCCNDKVIKAEIKTDQIIVKSLSFDGVFIAVTDYWKPQVFTPKNHFEQKDTTSYFCDANAPPLYVLYSQYTLYA